MFRKAGIGFAALAMMAPGIALALGVGDYELRSYLNQPLDMEVVLTDTQDLTPEEILISLASQKDFDTAGVERAYFLSDLKFVVEVNEQGGGTLNITSTQPVREPFLNFLVEVMWPTGRMLREYTVLLDPPSYEASSVETLSEPQASEPAQQPATETVTTEPAPETDTVVDPAPSSSPPAPVASSQSEPPASAEPAPETQPAGTYTGPREEYVVQANDTMWSIALRSRPRSSVSVQQMLVAIQELNPDAFIDGNVNLVREGTVLRLPTEEEVRRIRTRDALSEIADQNRAWREKLEARGIAVPTRPQLDGTRRSGSEVAKSRKPKEGKVTLVAPESGEAGKGESGATGATGGGGGDTAALENELAIRDENIDSMRRENEELNSRISDLSEQIQTSEKLLELRNNQIAQLEEQLRQLQAGQGEVSDATSTEITAEDLKRLAEAEAADAAAEEGADASEGDAASDEEQLAGEDGGSEAVAEAAGEEGMDGEASDAGMTAQGEEGDAGADGEALAGADEGATEAQDGRQDTAGSSTEAATAGQAGEQVTKADPARPASRPQPAQPAPEPGIMQLVMDNIIYIGAGIAALLLVVLGIVLMRNRQKSEADAESALDLDELDEGDDDFFVDSIDDEGDAEGFGELDEPSAEADEPAGQDPLEEVDVYTAYGRHAEAVTFLQNEIDKAPRRGDLKVRLLEVLAEMKDSDGFEREASRFADDRDVAARVDELRASLGGGAVPAPAAVGGDDDELSLDDLEMDLSSDLGGAPAAQPAEDKQASDDDFAMDLDMDLGGGDDQGGADDDDATLVLGGADSGADDDLSDFDLDLSGDDDDAGDQTDTLSLDSDDDFSLDLDGGDDTEGDDDLTLSLDDDGADDDDLGAELDAAMQVDSALDLGGSDDDLSLDLDDEDVSLEDVSSEFSEVAEEPASEEIDLSLDDLEMDDSGSDADLEMDLGSDLDADLSLDEPTEVGMTAVDEAPSGDTVQRESLDQATDMRPALDAADVDDDDFDFLGDTDENATKLDLAKAYIDMGDAEGARDILNEVVSEGNPDQQQEAKELLGQVS